ncbi:YhcH/YjgK/YiaL family protein [Bacteroides gallinarum]|uniref:YhcH/YjgK/YiaL family protein n=1 Tax=Bacteroides gallinarum TaxID=376806 RepID=UPI0004694860|nr:YhcH/YjgK/YiaL family protein [Bacteroides gallinarum]
MIVSNLQNSTRIEALHPLFSKLFDYVKRYDLLHTDCGRIELDGDNLFINNVNPTCIDEKEQVLEIHREYIDIHILLEGKERIGWKAEEELTEEKQSYQKDTDCALFTDRPTSFIDLIPDQFLIAFPEDAHAPVIGDGKIRKLIAKVRVCPQEEQISSY